MWIFRYGDVTFIDFVSTAQNKTQQTLFTSIKWLGEEIVNKV